MRFLIVSAPRSATAYMAQVLSALDIPCAHEWNFNLEGDLAWVDETYPGEASWLAAPHLRELPEDVLVLHQRRDRLSTALSIVRHGFFEPVDRFRRYAEQWVHTGYGLDIDRALLLYDGWNALIDQGLRERPHLGYRIEDLDERLLGRICGFLGRGPSLQRRREALRLPHVHSNREAA